VSRWPVAGPSEYWLLGSSSASKVTPAIHTQYNKYSNTQVNYTVQKAWKPLNFIMRVIKKGNSNKKSSAFTSLGRPIFESGASCWDPYRDGEINALDRVQKEAAKVANHTKDSVRETLAQRRKLARICALFKSYTGERARTATGDKLQGPCCLSSDDHHRKIRVRKQRKDIGKYPFVNRTICGTNCLQRR
jgi:hypothetical protein